MGKKGRWNCFPCINRPRVEGAGTSPSNPAPNPHQPTQANITPPTVAPSPADKAEVMVAPTTPTVPTLPGQAESIITVDPSTSCPDVSVDNRPLTLTTTDNLDDGSSTTVPTLSDRASRIITAAKNIQIAAAAVDESMDFYLDGLMSHISQLFKIIESREQPKKPSRLEQYLPNNSQRLVKFKEVFSTGIDAVKEFITASDAKTVSRKLLEGVGTAHLALAGLSVLANILETFETLSANKEECLVLMKEIDRLAKLIKQFRQWLQLKQEMENEIKEATVLIVEGSILCCTQIKSPRFFSASAKKAELIKFKQELIYMKAHISIQINICNLFYNKKAPLSKGYPDHAVGIEGPTKDVTDSLKWGGTEKALAVILHGFGGVGKSTLADAVFAVISEVDIQGFQYSKVKLFQDIDTPANIIELQKNILKDLMGTEKIPDIRKPEDGQRELGEMLKKVSAFIYIDNALGEDELSQLLPKDMNNAKRLRLLITARNKDVGRACRMETRPEIYDMKGIPWEEARSLLKRDIKEDIDDSQFNKIIEKCGGVPLMLTLVARFIGYAEDKPEAYRQFMEDEEIFKTEPFDKIESYLFAFDHLPGICQDPFLDICCFFKGWDWNPVRDIVGELALDNLKARAFVTGDTDGVVTVHDVILSLGLARGKQTRFKLTKAGQLKEFLEDKAEKDIQKIQGIWQSEDKDPFPILAAKLDSMSESLRILKLGTLTQVEGNCGNKFGKLILFQGAVPRLPFEVKMCKELKYLSYQPTDFTDLRSLQMLPPNLRHIEFEGRLYEHDFPICSRNPQQLNNLRILKLTHFSRLKTLPDQLGSIVKGLQELTLSCCSSIEELPQSITELQFLEKLSLQRCKNLKRLPTGFEKLSLLTLLDLSYCDSLLKLPHRIGYLKKLVNLSVNNCSSLTRIPESIGLNLFSKLDLSCCSSLRELPSLFVGLGNLRALNLSRCTRLERLPQGFGRLKCLVTLNLSKCSSLKQLCYDFHCLSSLEMLDLSECEQLEELTQNFHQLSLKHLYLYFCYKLEGKWMDNLVKMKTLQIIGIKGSSLLQTRWLEIHRKGNQSYSFAVYMEDLPNEEIKKHMQQELLSKLDRFLKDKQGKPFKISNLPINTKSLLIFHSDPDDHFPFPLIEEAIDDNQNGLAFKMFYVGKHFNKLRSKVKDNISAYSGDILEFGESWLSTLDANVRESWLKRYNAEEPIYFQMLVRGDTCSQDWKVLSRSKVEKFLMGQCKRYLNLKELAQTSQGNNLELLMELFAPREEEAIFRKNYASKDPAEPFTCGVHELKEKTILLEMGCADLSDDIGLSVLENMYLGEKDRLGLEIISIPIMHSNIKMKEQFSKNVPWLVLSNPLAISRAVRYFLVKQCGWEGDYRWGEDHTWYGSMIWIIEPNGKISTCTPFMLFMLNMWMPKVHSSPLKIFEELATKEWNQLEKKSNLEFLFSHLENVSNEVKAVGKITCIYGGNKELTASIRNALIELKDSIHIVYIPRYGLKKEMLMLTDSIDKNYYSWEKPEMSEVEMEDISLLNLSEHDAMKFWMRILFLKEEIEKREKINGIENMQVHEMKTLLDPFQLMKEEGSVVFMGEDGKMIATCRGDTMEWIFKEDGEDRGKRLIKRLIEVSKEKREQISMQIAVAVHQENVDINLDTLSQDTSELLGRVQLYQLLNFNKQGGESSRPNTTRANWPASIGFQRLKNFLFEETSSMIEDLQEDNLETVLQRLVEGISSEEHLAAVGVLLVGGILGRFNTISENRNECLILLEEMNRLSQYILKHPNEQSDKVRRATKWIVHCSIMCCAQFRSSKFDMFFKGSVNRKKVLGLQEWLRISQEELRT